MTAAAAVKTPKANRKAKAVPPVEVQPEVQVEAPEGWVAVDGGTVQEEVQASAVGTTALVPVSRALEGVVESSGDAAVASKPWDTWPALSTRTVPLGLLEVKEAEGRLNLTGPEGPLGRFTDGVGFALGWEAHFPYDFVKSLSPGVPAIVLNERLARERNRDLTLVMEDDQVSCLVPSGRELLDAATLADVTYSALQPLGNLTIQKAELDGHRMRLQLLTPREERVTRVKDDVLQMGVDVYQQYGQPMQFRLSTLRLVCLNGMTAFLTEYTWKDREARTRDAQIAWVRETIGQIQQSFGVLVERARLMANTPLQGEPILAFQATAHALGVRRDNLRNMAQADFNTERELVGNNQWALANAFTRFATHRTDQPAQFRRDLAFRAGQWMATDQLVIAELSRTVAQSVGARILEAR